MTPGAEDLQALARKYRALVALRARRDQGPDRTHPRGEPPPDREAAAALRELAREFPGCLRELDTLGAAELARRAEGAAAAAAGAAVEPWMAWITGYHRLMRAALAIRHRRPGAEGQATGAGGGGGDAGLDAAALASEVSHAHGADLDAAFVEEIASPPEGRIGIVVLRRLALLFGEPARTIADALFPLRRSSPYQL